MSIIPQRPDIRHTLTEFPRAGLEAARLAIGFRKLVSDVPRGDGRPALVLPSYGLGDSGIQPLRFFLRRIGYATPLSGINWNLDLGDLRIRRMEDAARFRNIQVDRVVERIQKIYTEIGAKPYLVGWSMGGLFAFDASQRIPDCIGRVVTLGSPFGDPRGTAVWNLMRWLSRSNVPVDQQDFSPWLDLASVKKSAVPVTVLYSEMDGIVGKEVARVKTCHGVRHRRVSSSHLGFATNPEVFREIAKALASNE